MENTDLVRVLQEIGSRVFKSACGSEPFTKYIEKKSVFLHGITIDVFDTPGYMNVNKSEIEKQYENTLVSIYKQLTERQKQNVIFVYNLSNSNRPPTTHDDFDCFLKCYKKRHAKLITVFTRCDDLFSEPEFTFEEFLLRCLPNDLLKLLQKNDIKSKGIENVGSFDVREKYRKELLSMCGINIL